MGQTKRTNLKYRGAIVAACAGLMTTVWACGDDSTGTMTTEDGGMDGSMSPETSTIDAPKDNAAPDVKEASTIDSPAESGQDASEAGTKLDGGADAHDGAVEAQSDAPADVRTDADATTSDAGDAGPDSTVDAEAGPDAMPPAPLSMCHWLDQDFGIDTDAGGCDTATGTLCPDRVSAWGNAIMIEYIGGPLNMDCRISSGFTSMSVDDVNQYQADVTAFTIALFGCPIPDDDAGPYPYGLIPRSLAGTWTFTSADLALLNDFYIQAVHTALQNDSANAVDLTTQQESDLAARLAYLASLVPGVVQSSTYSFDTCVADAGAEGGDAASDAPSGD